MRIRTFARRASQMMLLALGTVCVLGVAPEDALRAKTRRLREPSHSGPVAVSPDDRTVWVVNPDNASVTAIDVGKDRNRVIAHVKVGEEPQNLLISPDSKTVYVSNTVSGTVSVIRADDHPKVVETIEVGTEPWGMALTPNGRKLYVANARSNDVSVIDTEARRVIETIDGVGLEPRGVAITNDGDDESKDEKVLVTQFLGVDVPGDVVAAEALLRERGLAR